MYGFEFENSSLQLVRWRKLIHCFVGWSQNLALSQFFTPAFLVESSAASGNCVGMVFSSFCCDCVSSVDVYSTLLSSAPNFLSQVTVSLANRRTPLEDA